MMSNAVTGALQMLLFSNKNLEEAQSNSASGKRITDAKDNPGYWSTANALSSDQSVVTSIGDALNLGESTVDTAYTALEAALSQLSQMRSTLVTAYDGSIDRTKIATTLQSQKDGIASAVYAASFAGSNWLYNDEKTLTGSNSVVSSFQRAGTNSVTLKTQSIPAAETVLVDAYDASRGLLTNVVDANTLNPDGSSTARNYYLLDVGSTTGVSGTEITVDANTTSAQLDDMVDVIDQLMGKVTTMASRLGDMLNRITAQSEFADALVSSLKASVSRLVEANMEEVSVRLTAAKTQQSLASEAVNLANSNQQNLSILFSS